MFTRDMEMAEKVAKAVDKAGGRTYYVGGFIRLKSSLSWIKQKARKESTGQC